MCNYWLSQYQILRFIFRSACHIAINFQQNIAVYV